ncbi:FtsP/CotA-like multicopper oxidase with cupredoxin domain [Sediminihabitans luteus]|uniref:FtsP/CotA-like multicopper oxidase with cupredoxin domain n=1 Tax=Sediminihabitans luteus TaxID=1138585 RepID=A0A2M9D058_9CELL|nr:multicopper oxidase family protein [Sediminihabitans luteus]PJJ77582.1 FtsP/CotA-like multicopper oxidase with cupredoxin domain [Sediminihabitans luteus]GII98482.1 hypothetical protein Slu03_08600 [Sediminihabitans luteus]
MTTGRGAGGRVGLLVACAATLLVLAPIAWFWHASLLPGTYAVTSVGYVDTGTAGTAGTGTGTGTGTDPADPATRPGDGVGPRGATPLAHRHEAVAAGREVSVTDLDTDPTRRADVTVDLVARAGTVRLASGRTVEGYTLNGTSPGPLIEVVQGQLLEVHLRNESVGSGLTLHWHGVDVPNAQDGVAGVTQDAVPVGGEHTYRFVAPDSGTYWYHSHQVSHEQVVGGLLGALVVHPATPTRPVDVDRVVVAHTYGGALTLDGQEGDVRVPAEPGDVVRLRLVDTDDGTLTAWASVPYRVVAVDGHDVHEPPAVERATVGVGAGGRVDLEVVVPDDGTAARVQVGSSDALVVGPAQAQAPPVERPDDAVDLLAYGTPAPLGIDPASPDRSFEYAIGRRPGFVGGRPGMWWSVNGHVFPDLPMFMVREGDVVRITISNDSGAVHPIHLHGHHAVVLSRDGVAATGSPWWFDTLDVRDGETYEVAFVADNPGIWMDHCHNLQHAADGLVTHLMYEGVTTPYVVGGDTGNEPE